MGASARRVTEIEDLFARCRRDWKALFYELEAGEGSFGHEDPWEGLDEFVASLEAADQDEFKAVLYEMIEGDDTEQQAQALSVIGSTRQPIDMDRVMSQEDVLASNLEVRLELILAVGQRSHAAGRPLVDQALEDANTRHAASIALAQLDPVAAGPIGKERYLDERDRILASLGRPLVEREYETFYQMSLAVYEIGGKDRLNEFLRAVAGDDDELRHEMAQVVRRLVRQEHAEEVE